jgi:hypothetical protein
LVARSLPRRTGRSSFTRQGQIPRDQPGLIDGELLRCGNHLDACKGPAARYRPLSRKRIEVFQLRFHTRISTKPLESGRDKGLSPGPCMNIVIPGTNPPDRPPRPAETGIATPPMRGVVESRDERPVRCCVCLVPVNNRSRLVLQPKRPGCNSRCNGWGTRFDATGNGRRSSL